MNLSEQLTISIIEQDPSKSCVIGMEDFQESTLRPLEGIHLPPYGCLNLIEAFKRGGQHLQGLFAAPRPGNLQRRRLVESISRWRNGRTAVLLCDCYYVKEEVFVSGRFLRFLAICGSESSDTLLSGMSE